MKILDILLLENNYEDMFKGIPDTFAKYYNPKEYIKWAKEHLKKKDRITWYLRIKRLSVMKSSLFRVDGQGKDIDAVVNAELEKYNKRTKGEKLLSLNELPPNLETRLDHFLSLPIHKIQNYEFQWQHPHEVLNVFDDYESEWKESVKKYVVDDPENEIVIDFKDGYAWVNLNKEYCRKEGDAMGHCGNSAAYKRGDTVLSLRKKIVVNKDVFWEPHLTFILDRNGYLGEMKGRGNDKPSDKYHKYIIELLEDDIIEGIKGGGYMPKNNFSLADLDEQERERLVNKKPELFSIWDYIAENGIDEHVRKKMPEIANELGLEYLEQARELVVYEEDLKNFLRSHANDDDGSKDAFIRLKEIEDGDEDIEIDEPTAITIHNVLNDKNLSTLMDYAQKNFKQHDFFGVEAMKELRTYHKEIYNALLGAYKDSMLGAEKEHLVDQCIEWASNIGKYGCYTEKEEGLDTTLKFVMELYELNYAVEALSDGGFDNGLSAETVKNFIDSEVEYAFSGDYKNDSYEGIEPFDPEKNIENKFNQLVKKNVLPLLNANGS
jgi:hypothetical protein